MAHFVDRRLNPRDKSLGNRQRFLRRTRAEVKRAAHYVTTAPGGQGAIREVVELLLQAKGLWSDILKKYEVD